MTADYNPRAGRPAPPSHGVGYKRPPVAHQFKKGASGNPHGRPKAKPQGNASVTTAIDLARIVLVESYRDVEIRENGKIEKMPMIQAVLRSLGVTAAKGNHKAQMAIVGLAQAMEQRSLDDARELFETMLEFKINWEREFAACDRQGRPRPKIMPHPDDLSLDVGGGRVLFNGPRDEREKATWDQFHARKADALSEIAELKKMSRRRGADKASYDDQIRIEQNTIDLVDAFFPDEATRRRPDFDLHESRNRHKKLLEYTREERAKQRAERAAAKRNGSASS